MDKFLNIQPMMTDLPFGGTDWNYVELVRAVDGDTLRLMRTQVGWRLVESDELGDNLVRSEWKVVTVEDDIEDGPDNDDLPDGLSSRLIQLDTPERRQEGYEQATNDILEFCEIYKGRLRCVTYDTTGGFDRLLVDLYVMAGDGTVLDTASQWMMRQKGWSPYAG